MGAKKTIVQLERIDNGMIADFEVAHAERLLHLINSGWRLPKNSQYEYIDDAIRIKRNKKEDKGKREKGND